MEQSFIRICDLIREANKIVREALNDAPSGVFESEVEAVLVLRLASVHIDGVMTLAKQNTSYVPAAYHLARAAFECGVRAAWLVDEDDSFAREARWLVHLDSEISALRRAATERLSQGQDISGATERADQLYEFRCNVGRALTSRGVPILKQAPNFRSMLASTGVDHLWPIYIEASQYAHGGHAATWLYRQGGVGTHKEIADATRPEHWILPFRMCWLALHGPAEIVARRLGVPGGAGSDAFAKDIDQAFADFCRPLGCSIH